MRLASYFKNGVRAYGAVVEDGIVELSPQFPKWKTLKNAIDENGLDDLAEAASKLTAAIALSEVEFDLPIPDPGKIVCVGVNYPARNEEYADGQHAPPFPSLFVRFPLSFVGHGEAIVCPRESSKLDYEGEVALIVGRGGRRIPEERALDCIAGLTICNDGTVRDWVRHAKFNVTQGKNFDRSGSMGPWMVPFSGADQLRDIHLETRVNGEIRQSDRTGRLIFSPEKLIAYISTFTTLSPGDIIVTGTPVGSGARLDPPKFLEADDIVEIEVEGLGVLRNTVARES